MGLTTATALPAQPSAGRRELPAWAAAILAVAGNILAVGIVALGAAAVIAAAALIFGSALLAQI